MKEFGYAKVVVWLDASEVAMIDAAAERAGMRRATFVRAAAVAQAAQGDIRVTIKPPGSH